MSDGMWNIDMATSPRSTPQAFDKLVPPYGSTKNPQKSSALVARYQGAKVTARRHIAAATASRLAQV